MATCGPECRPGALLDHCQMCDLIRVRRYLAGPFEDPGDFFGTDLQQSGTLFDGGQCSGSVLTMAAGGLAAGGH